MLIFNILKITFRYNKSESLEIFLFLKSSKIAFSNSKTLFSCDEFKEKLLKANSKEKGGNLPSFKMR